MAARRGILGLVIGTGAALTLALGAVACRSSADAALEDAAILADVRRGLAEDLALAHAPIRVEVEKGVVTLEGRADRVELKEEAERVAREVQGVDRVRNSIQVIDISLPHAVQGPAIAEP
jgi:osmotically-inducible protein OsmY